MGVQQPAFISLVLVGMWVTSYHSGEGQKPAAEWTMRLTGFHCRCSGLLEVNPRGHWERVCRSGWNQTVTKMVCEWLGCGSPSSEIVSEQKPIEGIKLSCQGNEAALRNCHWEKSNCTQVLTVVCKDPEKTTTAPPTTTPEPTGPPRMRLVDGKFYCSGIVELYMGGHWGTVQSNPENETELARWVCRKIGCGDALEQKDRSFLVQNERQHLPVHWEMVASCGSDSIPDCFNRTRNSQDKTPASVICSSSQPRVMRRLGDSQSPCEGVMEVFHEGKWEVLCDSNSWKKSRGQQVCQELQCGKLSLSVQVPGAKTRGVSCSQQHLQECSTFKRESCSKTRVTCQNFKPRSAGVGAGTIVSILLALILFGVLIIICGPPAYKKLQKKYSKKQQRQWIGPTGLQQTVSFHRNSTVTLRPRQEGQGAQGEDNDYSQTPKKNSYLSAYPALEGAIRSSNPPDNSSDSDYDLHSARRL
ncbi:T-cell surface glycoprotein CD5 isoform X1 [Caretta caretta]|uniref:T-cell surface glycoprotein CD5 isoform X1 n=1 Tax=Caretta caretta TaxID=8467 RepID=UPI002094C457|nr:T-cell surface glycoprotein CD5 isoform X1 [Caretta caretta]